jgi:long-chain acyl-CoA synthetase
MKFWQLEQHSARTALISGSDKWSYATLAGLSDRLIGHVPATPGIGLLLMPICVESIALYLGALRSGQQAPLLLQPETDALALSALIECYQPEWLATSGDAPDGYHTVYRGNDLSIHAATDVRAGRAPHEDLALLLSTSGSTGSSKLVRLSLQNLASNAAAITQYLGLTSDDRAITTLPLAYSFGMSILNSHLGIGGSLVLSNDSLMTKEFWSAARDHAVTSLSGVPATFEMLRRMGIARMQLPSLRMLTQAGGRLRDELVRHFAEECSKHELQFYVMYGQTEASPRISYVPSTRILDKVGSIGIAVPGGNIQLDPVTSELIYQGPNVMLGYACSREDLAKPDEQHGVLRTGDLARCDNEGYYYITGRAKRFIKMSGNRVNLDEVETMLAAALDRQIVCSGNDDGLVVFGHGDMPLDQDQVRQLLQSRYKLFGGHVSTCDLDALPLLPTGKIDYQALQQQALDGASK